MHNAQPTENMEHVLDLCDGLSLLQLDALQNQIRDRRNARAGFLRLPGELRNRIYELVIESEILQPASSTYMDLYGIKKLLVGISGFNICKQIRFEFQSLLHLESIEICKYEDSDVGFQTINMDDFGRAMRRAQWFRAVGCGDIQLAQKSVRMCDDEMNVDYCGTISFGPALGLRPVFFAVMFAELNDKSASSR